MYDYQEKTKGYANHQGWAEARNQADTERGQVRMINPSGDEKLVPYGVWQDYRQSGEGEIGPSKNDRRILDLYLRDTGGGGDTRIVQPDKVDDTYLTEDEHRAEMAKVAHPTSLMMSNPLMPAAQQMLGNMGYGSGQMPGMNQMQDMNQFMEIPFSSGLGGMFPNNQIPINPSMPDGSLTQPAANKPGGNVPRGYGHTAGAAPSWTQGQTGQQGLMNNPMQGQGMNGMWNGLMGFFGGK